MSARAHPLSIIFRRSSREVLAIASIVVLALAPVFAHTATADSPTPNSAAAAHAAASPRGRALREFNRAIRAKYVMKEKAFVEHDAETIVSKLYAADVISIGVPEGIFIGRDQVRPIYQEVVRGSTVKVESVHTYVNGDAGWD